MDPSALKWDGDGLVTVVVQDRHTGELRMVGHADRDAVDRTLTSGSAWFYSRSRDALWKKGESSGNTLAVTEVWADCDGDAVVYLADPAGPTCHTDRRSCFFRRVRPAHDPEAPDGGLAAPTFVRFWDTLCERTASHAERSYTKSLLSKGVAKIGDKLREEADELARALRDESEDRVIAEAADLIYHLSVGLLARARTLRDVEVELTRRFGRSGHDEKASRT